MLFSNLFVKNVVQDLTSAGIDWQREKWQSGLGSKFIHQGEKNAAKYADEVIVLSKGVQDYFKETYGRETHFIPNGVNLSDDVSFIIAHNKKENDTAEVFSLLSYTNVNVLPFTEDIPLEVIAFLDPTIEKLCIEQSEGKTSIHLKFRDICA